MQGMRATFKHLLNQWAPMTSRRGRWLRRFRTLFRYATRPRALYRRIVYTWALKPIRNIYDLPVLRRYIRYAGVSEGDCFSPQPGTDPRSMARWVLHELLHNHEARGTSATPIRDGWEGPFAQRLARKLTGQPEAINHLKQAFEMNLGSKIVSMYSEFSDWRREHPLGLTPSGRGSLLFYLLNGARPFWQIPLEEILWFHFRQAEDATLGIEATYRVTPTWQEAHPAGLTPEGWPNLLDWVRQTYEVEDDWIRTVPAPNSLPESTAKLAERLASCPDASKAEERPFGINVLGHFRYPSGLQEAVLNTVAALEIARVPTAKRDVPNNHKVDLPDRTGYLDLEWFDVSLSSVAAVPLGEFRYPHAGLWRRKGVYQIASWYWELENIPTDWLNEGQHYQEMWAPTKFIADAFRKHLTIPVTHIAAGVRFPEPTGLSRTQLGLPEKPFLFLFMFDMCSAFERKNPLGVVESFRRAVGNVDSVRLVIKVSRGDYDPQNFQKLQEACASVNAILINRVMSRRESYGLLENCDAYVSLHRSEGYGLTMAEAMNFGKPVIATGYSGNLDFTTESNSKLIPYQLVQLERTYPPYPKGAFWAEPSLEAAAEAMEWMIAQPDDRDALARHGQAEVRRVLSLEAYGQRMRRRLEAIYREWDNR
jgi:glycosyltransferase involved in cell wall biosynthesis